MTCRVCKNDCKEGVVKSGSSQESDEDGVFDNGADQSRRVKCIWRGRQEQAVKEDIVGTGT